MTRKPNRHAIWLIVLITTAFATVQSQTRVAFWNVENYMDTQNDSISDDDEYTPEGQRHWTWTKFCAKRDGIAKTIITMQSPAIVALAEVENRRVLDELCKGSPLRNKRYSIIHHESADKRGIDCAIIYRQEAARLISERTISVNDSAQQYYTRDVLAATFALDGGDTLCLFVNHWPSKLGGALSATKQKLIADTVFRNMKELHDLHHGYKIVAIGDFNATYSEIENIAQRHGIANLMDTLDDWSGSYNYHGTWQLIDNIAGIGCDGMHGAVFYGSHLIETDKKRLGTRPRRTYNGMKYNGGISDHLPIYFDIEKGK